LPRAVAPWKGLAHNGLGGAERLRVPGGHARKCRNARKKVLQDPKPLH